MLAEAAPAESTPPKVVPLRVKKRRGDELEFLPAALEIIETPASPMGRAIAFTIIGFLLVALAWACLGKVDIIATAQGKIMPTGRTKTIQPLEAGTVTAIHVADGDKVREGDVLVEIDHTITTSERDRVAVELLRARLDVARLTALRAGFATMSAIDFVPPQAPDYEVLRTRAAMLAQAEQQAGKIHSLDQQIAQKAAEAEEIAATIDKLEAGLPFISETAELREKLLKQEFGNRLAYLDAQLKLSEQRHDLIVQQRRGGETAALLHDQVMALLREFQLRIEIGEAIAEFLLQELLTQFGGFRDERQPRLQLVDGGRDLLGLRRLLCDLLVERVNLAGLLLGLRQHRGPGAQHLVVRGLRRHEVDRAHSGKAGAQRRQPRHVEPGAQQLDRDAVAFGGRNGVVDFHQRVTFAYLVAVGDMDRGYGAGLQRLDGLGAPGRHDLALRGRDDVDLAEAGPGQRHQQEADNGERYGAAGGRRRGLDDLQRRRQKFQLVAPALFYAQRYHLRRCGFHRCGFSRHGATSLTVFMGHAGGRSLVSHRR